ncbi:hypothetical protein [Calothrix sp. 336/3]|uniref:hypothetical protein n=1 Tax=Calothrix sp. 336/3 TaxID=1337936 RepID=UPI0004E3C882|nr:hypothetical protein [Calothrix sp. 336/3]AKG23538.1 hypothetical protein IJ00_21660 [Calothrix sp. 336/3]
MNMKPFVIAAILGISSPVIADIAMSNSVVAAPAQRFSFPTGYFRDGKWAVELRNNDGEYSFNRIHLQTNQSIYISDEARISGTKARQIYTWYKDGYQYRVTFRPNDARTIRLEIYHPNGQAILNRLLYANR